MEKLSGCRAEEDRGLDASSMQLDCFQTSAWHLKLMCLCLWSCKATCVVQEDALLREGHSKYGNKWTEIAKMVGGRYTMILSGSLPTLHGDFCMQCACRGL